MVKKNIKLYADLGNLKNINELNKLRLIKGFTTNPTILKKNKIKNYNKFMIDCSRLVYPKPVSFEVVSDQPNKIFKEAIKIGKIRKNIYVKIPIVNSKGKKLYKIINELSKIGINLNITAVMTIKQIENIIKNISKSKTIISIFAGRIADTGIDPVKTVQYAIKNKKNKNTEILWASPREVLNYYQARDIKCDIITMTPDLIEKLKFNKYSLERFSIDTAKMFFNDAKISNLKV